jgi:uncharacterized protein
MSSFPCCARSDPCATVVRPWTAVLHGPKKACFDKLSMTTALPSKIGSMKTMSAPMSDLRGLLGSMAPVLQPGTYVFSSAEHGSAIALDDVVATIREVEGLSVVLSEARAVELSLPVLFRAAWITLTVHSDLAAVGLTAAVAAMLADAGISCNVVAGAHHDHLFVPAERGSEAVEVLRGLQRRSLRDESLRSG